MISTLHNPAHQVHGHHLQVHITLKEHKLFHFNLIRVTAPPLPPVPSGCRTDGLHFLGVGKVYVGVISYRSSQSSLDAKSYLTVYFFIFLKMILLFLDRHG